MKSRSANTEFAPMPWWNKVLAFIKLCLWYMKYHHHIYITYICFKFCAFKMLFVIFSKPYFDLKVGHLADLGSLFRCSNIHVFNALLNRNMDKNFYKDRLHEILLKIYMYYVCFTIVTIYPTRIKEKFGGCLVKGNLVCLYSYILRLGLWITFRI